MGSLKDEVLTKVGRMPAAPLRLVPRGLRALWLVEGTGTGSNRLQVALHEALTEAQRGHTPPTIDLSPVNGPREQSRGQGTA